MDSPSHGSTATLIQMGSHRNNGNRQYGITEDINVQTEEKLI
jgi:hypothetical protein